MNIVIFFHLFFPLLTFVSLRFLSQSPTPSIFYCSPPFSTHSFQISLNVVFPSHSRSSSPPFPLHFLGICSLCHFFICHSFHVSGSFKLIASFFLKLSFTPCSTLSSSNRLLSAHQAIYDERRPSQVIMCALDGVVLVEIESALMVSAGVEVVCGRDTINCI